MDAKNAPPPTALRVKLDPFFCMGGLYRATKLISDFRNVEYFENYKYKNSEIVFFIFLHIRF